MAAPQSNRGGFLSSLKNLAVPGAVGLGTGLINQLFGSDDEFLISPEARQLIATIQGKLGTGDFGFSSQERESMINLLQGNLRKEAESQTGRTIASATRRGVASPGQFSGIASSASRGASKAFGKGLQGINIAGAQAGRQEEQFLLSLLGQLSQGQFREGRPVPGLEELGQNVTLASLLRGNAGS